MSRQAELLYRRTDLLSVQTGRTVVQADRTAVQQALVCLFVCCMDPSMQQTNKHTNDRFAPAWRHVGMRGQPLVPVCLLHGYIDATNKHTNDMSRQTDMLFRQTELVSMQT